MCALYSSMSSELSCTCACTLSAALMYSPLESGIQRLRGGEEDPLNSVAAATITGVAYKSTGKCGFKRTIYHYDVMGGSGNIMFNFHVIKLHESIHFHVFSPFNTYFPPPQIHILAHYTHTHAHTHTHTHTHTRACSYSWFPSNGRSRCCGLCGGGSLCVSELCLW